LIIILLFSICSIGQSQNIHIAVEQDLSFGDFYFSGNTASGTVTLSNNGEWSATGNIHQLRSNHQPAVFNISTESRTPVNVGVEILTRTLTNQNGDVITLDTKDSRITFYKIRRGYPARVFIGGSLKITPKTEYSQGDYKGSISIIVTAYNE
jgi:hypothetical protein